MMPVKRRRNRRALLLWGILLVLALVLFGFSGGILPSVFLAAVLLIPVTSAGYALFMLETLRFYQELEPVKITKGERGTFRLVCENAGLFPVQGVRLILEESPLSWEGVPEAGTFDLYPGERKDLSFPCSPTLSGTYPVGARAYALRDFWGLFSYELPIGTRPRALVRPRVTDRAAALLLGGSFAMPAAPGGGRDEAILSGETRQYQPGDPRRAIHWKAYARTGEVLVRRHEEREIASVLLVALPEGGEEDRPGESPEGRMERLRRRDLFLELFVSAVSFFTGQGRRCIACFPRGEWQRFSVEDAPGFGAFYEAVSDGVFVQEEGAEERAKALAREYPVTGGAAILLREKGLSEKEPFSFLEGQGVDR